MCVRYHTVPAVRSLSLHPGIAGIPSRHGRISRRRETLMDHVRAQLEEDGVILAGLGPLRVRSYPNAAPLLMSCGACHVSCCALCGAFYVATGDLDYRMRRVDTAWQRLLLESSNPAKYSEHIVVHLPRDTVFDNNVSMGFFVARLLARSSSLAADGLNRDWAHPRCLWRPFSPSVGRCPHGTGPFCSAIVAPSTLTSPARPPARAHACALVVASMPASRGCAFACAAAAGCSGCGTATRR